MRARAECRVTRELKEDYAETTLDPRSRRRVEIQSKHKHRDFTGEHEWQTNRNPNV